MSAINKYRIIIYLWIILFSIKNIYANECDYNQNLKIGLIENKYIDYQQYLYYTLGNFSSQNLIEFEINDIKYNADEYDIIFGEHYDLNKLSKKKINLPKKINDFYANNGIQITNNILPLDLDTFILLSEEEIQVSNLNDLIKKNNFNKYSIGISFDSKQNFLNILNYISGQKSLDFNTHQIESSLSFFKANFNYMNNHILYDDYDKLYNSYLDRENVFTFFSDGILLYKNLRDINFNLLPKSDYLWDTNKGQFINNYEFTNTSFFGFSAYINNIDNIGFLCFLTDAEIRNKTFKNFNIQLSPLSINEINEKDIINSTHKYLLQNKNKNISSIDLENSNKETNLMFQYFFDEIKYKQLIEDTNYLSN